MKLNEMAGYVKDNSYRVLAGATAAIQLITPALSLAEDMLEEVRVRLIPKKVTVSTCPKLSGNPWDYSMRYLIIDGTNTGSPKDGGDSSERAITVTNRNTEYNSTVMENFLESLIWESHNPEIELTGIRGKDGVIRFHELYDLCCNRFSMESKSDHMYWLQYNLLGSIVGRENDERLSMDELVELWNQRLERMKDKEN